VAAGAPAAWASTQPKLRGGEGVSQEQCGALRARPDRQGQPPSVGQLVHAIEEDETLPCEMCRNAATIGLARRRDGLWARLLCSPCFECFQREREGGHALEHDGTVFGPGEALGLAGKCRRCRTKASYGMPSSPPVRCMRHKRVGDVVRALGTTCVFAGCKKARLFGSHGGVALYCAAHRLPDHVDVKNKRCQFRLCKRQASYGDAATRMKSACAMHRLPEHVDLKHERKRCAAPEGCCKLGVFKRRLIAPLPGPCASQDVARAGASSREQNQTTKPDSDLSNRGREDGWVFVCASHLNLNVFSASSPQGEGLRKKLSEQRRRQTSRGLYAHIAQVLAIPAPHSRVALLQRAIEHLSNASQACGTLSSPAPKLLGDAGVATDEKAGHHALTAMGGVQNEDPEGSLHSPDSRHVLCCKRYACCAARDTPRRPGTRMVCVWRDTCRGRLLTTKCMFACQCTKVPNDARR